MNIVYLTNELQFNILVPLSNACFRAGIKLTIISVNRTSSGFGDDISPQKIKSYLLSKGLDSVAMAGDTAFSFIESEKPHFIFFSTPYEMYFPKELAFSRLSKISTLCLISYGAPASIENINWFNSISNMKLFGFHFVPVMLRDYDLNFYNIGFVKSETVKDKVKDKNKFNIGWRPRWTISDDSSLIEYQSVLMNDILNCCDTLYFFGHPLLWKLLSTRSDLVFVYERLKYLEKNKKIIIVPDDEYFSYFLEINILISDAGSGICEANEFGVPVIFTGNYDDLHSEVRNRIVNNYRIAPSDLIEQVLLLKNKYRFSNYPILNKKPLLMDFLFGGLTPSDNIIRILKINVGLQRFFGRPAACFFQKLLSKLLRY